jgi:hypothetical protein
MKPIARLANDYGEGFPHFGGNARCDLGATLSRGARRVDAALGICERRCNKRRCPLPTTRRHQLDDLRMSLSDEDRDLLVLRVEQGLAWKEIATAFLEESDSEPEAVAREAARLRQRFRSIRMSVASVTAHRKASDSEKP